MTDDSRLIPAGSQTVGPFFCIGLDYLIDRAPVLDEDMAGRIEIRGRVLDRDGTPVPDAVLEFWTPRITVSTSDQDPYPFRVSARSNGHQRELCGGGFEAGSGATGGWTDAGSSYAGAGICPWPASPSAHACVLREGARQYGRYGAAASSSRASSHSPCSTRQSSDEFVPMGPPSAGPG